MDKWTVAAVQSCRSIDTCVDIYFNRDGRFERQNLNIGTKEKIQVVEAADLNNDGRQDLVDC